MLDRVPSEPEDDSPLKRFMTADEFAARRMDFPEGGRWVELHEGFPVLLQAPDDAHGNVVLNISREFAVWFQAQGAASPDYAGYDLGLHVSTDPDTIYFPAISCFNKGPRFEQNDLLIASQRPHLVVDIASSNDRRRDMRLRTLAYLKMGVETIWIPDPFKREVQVVRKNQTTVSLGDWQILEGGQALPGFSLAVKTIFAQPSWWTGTKR
ncbi:MAG: Uma2 family endonuclease [Planctomycetaceae bacterium]|nr:Uma2 family endonuclease [Planctomycetaceae bacterium]